MNNTVQATATFFGATDTGRKRTNNEDNLIACAIRGGSHLLLAAIDGIGGYEGGEVAAQIARDVIVSVVEANPESDCLELLKDAVTQANNAIHDEKKSDPMRSQMGCVLSSAIISLPERRVYMVHVGDSRLYQYTPGEGLRKLSHDHSLVGYREEIGMLTEEQAMTHPQRNIIERSLGEMPHSRDDQNFLDAGIFPIFGSSQYLFCSDGLSDMLYSHQIASVLACDASAEDEVRKLIAMANDAGGKDNITAVIAKVTVAGEPGTHFSYNAGRTASAFEATLPQADNSDDYLSATANGYRSVNGTQATSTGKSPSHLHVMIISIALAFLAGGTAGFFAGRYSVELPKDEVVEPVVMPDTIINAENDPDSLVADPLRMGEQTADSINAAYRSDVDSALTSKAPSPRDKAAEKRIEPNSNTPTPRR